MPPFLPRHRSSHGCSSRTAARSPRGSPGRAPRWGSMRSSRRPTGRPPLDLLDADAVVRAALAARCDAVHPGFGFLAENADFAERVRAAGMRWVGPPPAAIRAMGDKAAARKLAASLGVPVLPGYDGPGQSNAVLGQAAKRIGYPVLVKPAAGGGGKGMRIVRDAAAPARCPRRRPPRGGVVVRRRASDPRAVRRGRPPHRDPGPLRCPGERRPPRGAGLLDPASPPEDPRGDAVAVGRRCAPGEARRLGADPRARGRVRERRHLRVPRRRARHARVPRDEHAPPGRAPGDGARHRPGPGRRPAPDRGGRTPPVHAGRGDHLYLWPRDRGAPLRGGRRGRLPPADRPHRGASLADRRGRPGGCGRRARDRGDVEVRPDARQDHRLGADTPRRPRPADGRPRRHARPRRRHEPAVPSLAGAPAGGPRRARADRHARTDLAAGRLGGAGRDPRRGMGHGRTGPRRRDPEHRRLRRRLPRQRLAARSARGRSARAERRDRRAFPTDRRRPPRSASATSSTSTWPVGA